MDIRVTPRIYKLMRIYTLFRVIQDLARGFGVSEKEITIIEKGVIEKQVFERIEIFYLNASNDAVCKATLYIDWGRYNVSMNSPNEREFLLDTSKSIREQVSLVYSDIIRFMQDLQNDYNKHICKIEVYYYFIDEINLDKKRLAEERQRLGLISATVPKWVDNHSPHRKMSFQANRLQELGVGIEWINQ